MPMSDAVRKFPSRKEQEDARAALLQKMGEFYMEASLRLDVRARPVTLTRLLDAGICIGLLDPVSNIMVNSIGTSDLLQCDDVSWGNKVLVAAFVDEKLDQMARRSLEGLVALLALFFPCLTDWEAEYYLLLANADLLIAAHLIVRDRDMRLFSLASPVSAPAFKEALALAAQIAQHPQPERLVQVWMLLSSSLHRAIALLSDILPQSPQQNQDTFKSMLRQQPAVSPDLCIPWDLAALRSSQDNTTASQMPYHPRRALRMLLLDTIHGFYLQALAMLPRGDLRSRLHRSLLKAGYCYGPMDPVSNIILNTIWYDVNFPAPVNLVFDVIAPKCLTRLESRSCYGLISFLLTRHHGLSKHKALQFLLAASAHLAVADRNLLSSSSAEEELSAGLEDAYRAAATKARHTNPEEHALFLSLLDGKKHCIRNPLTSQDVQRLSRELSPNKQITHEILRNSSYSVRIGKMRFEVLHKRITKNVEAALHKHMLQDGAHDLHIICCVNDNVGLDYCSDVENHLYLNPYKLRYSHVNFLATPKVPQLSDPYPKLFFAEFDNEGEDNAPLLCCRIDVPTPFSEHARCFYCEVDGARVVHPTLEKFHGGGTDFAAKFRGEDKSLIKSWHISYFDHAAKWVCALEEDFIYSV